MRLSEHFTLAEMIRSEAATRLGVSNDPAEAVTENLRALCLTILEPLHAAFGHRAVRINSGYRSPEANKAVGGKSKSSHMNGEAADLEIETASNLDVARWIAGSGLPFDQVILEFHTPGIPSSGWVHVSHRRLGHNRKETLLVTRNASGIVSESSGLP